MQVHRAFNVYKGILSLQFTVHPTSAYISVIFVNSVSRNYKSDIDSATTLEKSTRRFLKIAVANLLKQEHHLLQRNEFF